MLKLLALLAAATAATAAPELLKATSILTYPLGTTSIPVLFYWQNSPTEPVGVIDVHLSIAPDFDTTVDVEGAIATVNWQGSTDVPDITSITTEPFQAGDPGRIYLEFNVTSATFSTPSRYSTSESSIHWSLHTLPGLTHLSLMFESGIGGGLGVLPNANPQSWPKPPPTFLPAK